MTDQHETPEFRPVGDEWERCKEPDGAPLDLRKFIGKWWKHRHKWYVFVVQDGRDAFVVTYGSGVHAFGIGKEWSYKGWSNIEALGASLDVTRYEWREPTAEQRRAQALRELPDLVMQRLAEARQKHPEPQSIDDRLKALFDEIIEATDACDLDEGVDRIKDELIDVIVVAVRALSEELAS